MLLELTSSSKAFPEGAKFLLESSGESWEYESEV